MGHYIFIISLLILFVLLYQKNKNSELFSNKMKLVLITQFYQPNNKQREKEIIQCLINNINNNLIDKIILFGEKKYNMRKILGSKISLEKINYINIGKRLNFKYVFDYYNSYLRKKI